MDCEMPSRERILAYLLGELPPAELAEIDRRLLTDEAFGDLLEDARHELLEACALGTLTEAESDRAHRALNLPPAGRGRSGEADFSRALAQALRRTAPRPGRESRARAWRGRRVWAAALAAGVVAAVGLWLVLRGAGPGPGVVGGGSSPPGAAFVLLLRPAVLRGPASGQTVRLPAALQSLETQIVVPDASGRYEVRVQSAAGQFEYRNLTPRSLGGVSFVQLAIARDRLPPGTERFLLLQVQPGPPRRVQRYSVHVIAP
jgi:hypothetical protein